LALLAQESLGYRWGVPAEITGSNAGFFEKAPDVGGLWRENYHSFGIQVTDIFIAQCLPMVTNDKTGGKLKHTPEIKEETKVPCRNQRI
jgi:hypothetical protein